MVTTWKVDLMSGVWSIFVVLLQLPGLVTKEVFLHRYGDCFRPDYIDVEEDGVYTLLSEGGEAYDTLVCEMNFRSTHDDRLCISFTDMQIHNCGVRLQIFSSESSKNNPAIGNYDCHTERIPEPVCSDGRYLTVLMRKKELGRQGYKFNLNLHEYSNRDAFGSGADAFIMSIGVVVGIIAGVIGVVILTALLIVCCCCKNRQYGLVNRQQHKSASLSRTAATEVPVEPSAPPFPVEDPPPYCEHPPQYTTTSPEQTGKEAS